MKELTSDELVAHAVKYARARRVGCTCPRWVAVMELFALGRTSAQALCLKFGEDPDEEVPGIDCERCEESEENE